MSGLAIFSMPSALCPKPFTQVSRLRPNRFILSIRLILSENQETVEKAGEPHKTAI